MGKPKGQKFTLADFTSMVGQKDAGDSSWADEEVDLPTAPTGASRPAPSSGGFGAASPGEYRPGRGSSDRVGPADLTRIPATGPFTAYVGNLPYTITESSLKSQLFAGFAVTELRVPMEPGTGKARGFAYATFPSAEEMGRAMQALHGKEFGGRPVRLDVSESSSGGSGKSAFGEWRSAAGPTSGPTGGPRGMEDRPGRRPDPSQFRSSSGHSGHYQQPREEGPRDWRTATPSSVASSSSSSVPAFSRRDEQDRPAFSRRDEQDRPAFGRREEQDRPAFGHRDDQSFGHRDESDRPGRRPQGPPAPSAPRRSADVVITRDDFGKKL